MLFRSGRLTAFKDIGESKKTIVFYESPHRILKALQSLATSLGDERTVVVLRELTKIHESVIRGSAKEVLEYFSTHPQQVRGEFMVCVST